MDQLHNESEALRIERDEARAALARIAATEPKMNLGRKFVDVPLLDAWEAQKTAAAALGIAQPQGERDTP